MTRESGFGIGASASLASSLLWLDTAPGAGDRFDAIRSGPGVTQSSLWVDCAPGRTDLPRRLPGIDTLGVHAVDETFVPPPGAGGLRFRRTPRPGQGRLSDRPTTGLVLVLIAPKHPGPDAAAALRDWADFVHIAQIAATGVPGYSMITPYELDGPEPDDAGPRYLHLYELDSDEPEVAFGSMTPLVKARLDDEQRFTAWAWHPELRIDYVSSYRRLA